MRRTQKAPTSPATSAGLRCTLVDGGLSNSLLIVSLFPYVSPFPTAFDTQPYALVLAMAVIFHFGCKNGFTHLRIPFALSMLGGVFVYATVMFWLGATDIGAQRSLVGYLSIFVIAWAAYLAAPFLRPSVFLWIVYVWFFFGIAQTVVSRSLGAGLLTSMRTSDGRGVTSLGVEPSIYAIMCIFFLILNEYFYARGNYRTATRVRLNVLVALQLVFAGAGVGFILSAVYLIAHLLAGRGWKQIVRSVTAGLVIGVIAYLMFTQFDLLSTSRMGILIDRAIANPSTVVLSDGSISDRLFHIVVSHSSIFQNGGFGFGLNSWREASLAIAPHQSEFIQRLIAVNVTYDRAMSGWGSMIVELGWVGLVPLLSFFVVMRGAYKSTASGMRRCAFVAAPVVYAAMLMAVSISFPPFGLLLGIFSRVSDTAQSSQATGDVGDIQP